MEKSSQEEINQDKNKKKIDEEKQNSNFKLSLDYENNNPFAKTAIGGSIGALAGAGIVGGGAYLFLTTVSETIFLGSAFAVLGGAAATGIGLLFAVPGLIGVGGYTIYKKIKNKKMQEYYQKMKTNQKIMQEEKLIFQKVFEEMKNYYYIGYKHTFLSLQKELEEYTREIMKVLIEKKKELDKQRDEEEFAILEKKVREATKGINIILIGKTGVGKSTLINGILNLDKSEKAKIGEGTDPQVIEGGWPKKYSKKGENTGVEGINLFDTEGIEIQGENGIENHKENLLKFIQESYNKHIPIHAIWYCIHGNKLEEAEKKYIEELTSIFANSLKSEEKGKVSYKVPIIFVYTQAYESEADNIEKIQSALEKMDCLKGNLNYIDVVAERREYNRRGKKGAFEIYNLDKLKAESYKISPEAFGVSIKYLVGLHFNGNECEYLTKIMDTYKDIYQEIIQMDEKSDKIFETFKDKLRYVFKSVLGLHKYHSFSYDISYKIENFIDKIYDLMNKLKEEKYRSLREDFKEKHTIQESLKSFINDKWEEKEQKIIYKDKKEFVEKVENYLIWPVAFRKKQFGLFFIFDIFFDTIIQIIINEFDILKKNKIDEVTEKLNEITIESVKKFADKFENPANSESETNC